MEFTEAKFRGHIKLREGNWVANNIASLGAIAKPNGRRRRVVFTAFTRFGFSGKGKVYTEDYFPKFTHYLAENDVDTYFVWSEQDLIDLCKDCNYAIIHLYNEEKYNTYTPAIRQAEMAADVVFCTQRAASIVSNKKIANRFFTENGISMPKELITSQDVSGKVFSNHLSGSGKRVIVSSATDSLLDDRYNTDFVDTRIDYGGKTWYTMFRIQAVGQNVHHAYVRARDVAERAPSVHSKDTPANAGLIEYIYDKLIAPRRGDIAEHTRKMGELLGPGFYAHDMIVCRESGKMFMVESGFKFNDSPYANYISSVQDDMPSNRIFYDSTYPTVSAYLFLKAWAEALRNPPPAPWMVLTP